MRDTAEKAGDARDKVTEDMLTQRLTFHEKALWMLRAIVPRDRSAKTPAETLGFFFAEVTRPGCGVVVSRPSQPEISSRASGSRMVQPRSCHWITFFAESTLRVRLVWTIGKAQGCRRRAAGSAGS